MVDSRQTIRPDKTKWVRTVKCGCDECRFKDPETRGVCPMINEPGAIWLWTMSSPDMIGIKDYIDPLDFGPPSAYTERSEQAVGEVNSEPASEL